MPKILPEIEVSRAQHELLYHAWAALVSMKATLERYVVVLVVMSLSCTCYAFKVSPRQVKRGRVDEKGRDWTTSAR